VDEPTVEDTISILRGLKERYEVFHGVKITDGALVTAAMLSHRYISDRFLPDKAIDLVDEACALIKTELDTMPAELDELQRRVMQLEIEEAALKKETDHWSMDRLENLQKELAELRDDFNVKKAQWDNEKSGVERLSKLREDIETMHKEIALAQRNYDLEKAAELQYGRLPQLQKQLEIEEEKIKNQEMTLVHESVTDEEIAKIISRWTGIPVAKLTESERNKTLHLDEELHKRVIGQEEGVIKVTEAMNNYVVEKLKKIDKYLDNPEEVKASVVVRVEKQGQKVEITIPLKNFMLRAEETQEDIYAAVDTIIDKIERQIRKNKTKLESQAKKSREVKGFVLDEIIEVEEDEVEETKIVKRKKVDVKPMSEEEAVLQMELLGHDFYLFKDADTMKPALVYKRKDNQYGIIETE
jgi:ribosomal subunit interface protein